MLHFGQGINRWWLGAGGMTWRGPARARASGGRRTGTAGSRTQTSERGREKSGGVGAGLLGQKRPRARGEEEIPFSLSSNFETLFFFLFHTHDQILMKHDLKLYKIHETFRNIIPYLRVKIIGVSK
jgi:hypothetical protein